MRCKESCCGIFRIHSGDNFHSVANEYGRVSILILRVVALFVDLPSDLRNRSLHAHANTALQNVLTPSLVHYGKRFLPSRDLFPVRVPENLTARIPEIMAGSSGLDRPDTALSSSVDRLEPVLNAGLVTSRDGVANPDIQAWIAVAKLRPRRQFRPVVVGLTRDSGPGIGCQLLSERWQRPRDRRRLNQLRGRRPQESAPMNPAWHGLQLGSPQSL